MIYLDHAASSPLRPEVLDAMRPWLGAPGNPASVHRAGRLARAALERARDEVAALVGGPPSGVVFTSGATEANHLFLAGIVAKTGRSGLAFAAIEHPCIEAAARAARANVYTLAVGPDGRVLEQPLPDGLAAVSLMAVNHETGVLQPLAWARAASAAVGAALHVDAAHGAGRVDLDLGDADGVTLSAHKLGGPVGIGALVLRDRGPFPAQFDGPQERGRRGGTSNVAGAVGFAEAARLARIELRARSRAHRGWTDALAAAAIACGGRVVGGERVASTLCVVFPGIPGEAVVQALDVEGICASSGAACASGAVEASPVLRAMGDPEPAGGVRFSVGWSTTAAEIDAVCAALPMILRRFQVG